MQSTMTNGSMAAKLSAKKGKLLSSKDLNALSFLKSVGEIASYLRKTEGYGAFIDNDENIHRDRLEECIYLSLIDDYESLYTFSNTENRKFLQFFFLKREIWVIKSLMYSILNGDTPSAESLPAAHRSFDVDEAVNCKTIDALASLLSGTPYGAMLERGGSIFEIETSLDKYYFDRMFKSVRDAQPTDREAALELIGTEADAVNILWIYRAKKYYSMPPAKIRESVLPHKYKISAALLNEMIDAASSSAVIQLAGNTRYGALFTPDNMEYGIMLSSFLQKLNFSVLSKYQYSSVSALAFLHIKRTEIQNITAITEGVRYGISAHEIQKHLVKGGDTIGNS